MRAFNTSLNYRPRAIRAGSARPHGISLLEVLVAVVILAFGMLGLAGLQSRTLGYSQASLYRSQATALADDIFDRMRADRQNAKDGRWDSALNAASNSIGGSAIYQTDLADWKRQVEQLLPSGRASIAIDAATGIVTVTIEWDDSRGRESAQQFVTRSRL